jgi:hypothetical protein
MRVVQQRIARAEIQQAHTHPFKQPARRFVAGRGFRFHDADSMQPDVGERHQGGVRLSALRDAEVV